MERMRAPRSLAADRDFALVSMVARTLQPVLSCDRRAVLRDEAALLLDGLLVRVARGRGALDLALGEGLASLAVGDRLLRLGFSCPADYARERLGISGSTAEKLARLARNLADRPLLRQAVRSGAVSARKAETVAPVARGEAEAAWVEKARSGTVRGLAAEVRATPGRRRRSAGSGSASRCARRRARRSTRPWRWPASSSARPRRSGSGWRRSARSTWAPTLGRPAPGRPRPLHARSSTAPPPGGNWRSSRPGWSRSRAAG